MQLYGYEGVLGVQREHVQHVVVVERVQVKRVVKRPRQDLALGQAYRPVH